MFGLSWSCPFVKVDEKDGIWYLKAHMFAWTLKHIVLCFSSNWIVGPPRFDLIFHPCKRFINRAIVAHYLAFINLNSIVDLVSQECNHGHICWKIDTSVISKVIKNVLELISIALQEYFSSQVCLPWLRSTLSESTFCWDAKQGVIKISQIIFCPHWSIPLLPWYMWDCHWLGW